MELENIVSRHQIIKTNNLFKNQIQPDSSVIHINCGDGDCLLGLAPSIRRGIGLDSSENSINNAIRSKMIQDVDNLYFLRMNGLKITENIPGHFDIAMTSFYDNDLSIENNIALTKRMAFKAQKLLIAAPSSIDTEYMKYVFDESKIQLEDSVETLHDPATAFRSRNLMRLFIGIPQACNS